LRGTEYERDLAYKLYKRGWAVIRAPASGARAKRYLYPDLVAVKKGRVLAIEVKTLKDERTLYISERQVNVLREWEERAGAEAWIAVKVRDGRGWRFYSVENLVKTNSSWRLELKGGISIDELDLLSLKLNKSNLDLAIA